MKPLTCSGPVNKMLLYFVPSDLDRSVSDNYTCAVRNPFGSDRATWEVVALAAPPRPHLRLAANAPARLHLSWDAPATGQPVNSQCRSIIVIYQLACACR